VTLGLIFVGLNLGLHFLVRGMIQQNNDIALVASTLAIASLFEPLRRQIQTFIDRRFSPYPHHQADHKKRHTASSRTIPDSPLC